MYLQDWLDCIKKNKCIGSHTESTNQIIHGFTTVTKIHPFMFFWISYKVDKEMRIIFLNLFLEHGIIWSNFSQVCDEAKLKESIYSKVKIDICTPLEPEQHISEYRRKYLRKDH